MAARSRRAIEQQPIWEWAGRNLLGRQRTGCCPQRIASSGQSRPGAPTCILPLFAFSATGVSLAVDVSTPDGSRNPCWRDTGNGRRQASRHSRSLRWLAITARVARAPVSVTVGQFIGAACLCGIGDTMALLLADRAFPQESGSAIAKLGVLVGSTVAALLRVLQSSPPPREGILSRRYNRPGRSVV